MSVAVTVMLALAEFIVVRVEVVALGRRGCQVEARQAPNHTDLTQKTPVPQQIPAVQPGKLPTSSHEHGLQSPDRDVFGQMNKLRNRS